MSSCLESSCREEVAVSPLQCRSLSAGQEQGPVPRYPQGGLSTRRSRKIPPFIPSILFLSFLPSSVQHVCPLANWLPFMKRRKRGLGVIFQIVEAGLSHHRQGITQASRRDHRGAPSTSSPASGWCWFSVYLFVRAACRAAPTLSAFSAPGTPHTSSCL